MGLPDDIITNTDPGEPTAVVTWIPPTATDNTGDIPLTLTSTYDPGDKFEIGITTVAYVVKDRSGNLAMASFTITVVGK